MDTFKATPLNTDSFNLNDINLLQVVLNDKFYLITLLIQLIQKRKEQWAIVISVRQIQSLASIVGLISTTIAYKVTGLI
jgi:hypothetical protein